MSHQVIEYPGIMLNGEEYDLVDDATAAGMNRKSWGFELKPQATKREPRPDVRPGEVAGEWVRTWDDFSGGMTGDLENRPGAVHIMENVVCLEPGHLRPTAHQDQTSTAGGGGRALDPLMFNDLVFAIEGRYANVFSGGAIATDKDFGAGILVTDAVLWNHTGLAAAASLVVGFGGSTNKIQARNAAGTWTTATDATYADHFTQVQDRLWRATATNQVSNIASGANPLTLANWSSGITVGDAAFGISDLNALGIQLLVSKPDGAFLGDAGAVFPNKLPAVYPDPFNGARTLAVGSSIFYPHATGLFHVEGNDVRDIGPQLSFRSAELADTLPGLQVQALAAHDGYLYAACQASDFPKALPTGVRYTTNGGTSYTDLTTSLTDNSVIVASTISLTTVAGNSYLLVGYSATFFGIELLLTRLNTAAATLVFEYWSGSAWVAVTPTSAGVPLRDGTDVPSVAAPAAPAGAGITLSRSGTIYASSGAALSTIDGLSAIWCRLSASGTTDVVTASELRVLSGQPAVWVYRIRIGDLGNKELKWEYVCRTPAQSYHSPGGMAVVAKGTAFGGGIRGPKLMFQCANTIVSQSLNRNDLDPGFRNDAGGANFRMTTARHDGGAPLLNEQFLDITVKARNVDANRDLQIEYRTDFASSWTTAASSITASPTTTALTGITGRAIQLRAQFNAFTTNPFPEILSLEVRSRELPTMKREWNYLVKIVNDGITAPETVLSNLEALVGAAAVSHMDPYRRAYTANVVRMGASELYRDGSGVPGLAVPIVVAEV